MSPMHNLIVGDTGFMLSVAMMFVGLLTVAIFRMGVIPKLRKENNIKNIRLLEFMMWFDGVLFVGGGTALMALHYYL